MKEKAIKSIVDVYLQKLVEREINKRPGTIEFEMTDSNQNKEEEWKIWYPIDSKVTDSDFGKFEESIGYPLPHDYKIFLKYKHFYDLYISEVSFYRHPINTWKNELAENIFNGYPREYLIDKGFIPFADWSDWGLLCFDTNRQREENNYPIVLWDHEVPDEVQDKYEDFFDLLIKTDEEERSH